MKLSMRLNRLALAGILAAAGGLSLLQAAHAGPSSPTVPTRIQVPDGNKLFLAAHAVGVQIYGCSATTDGFAWALVAPHANLYDENGKLVATHFGGPTWEAKDGSRVVGQLVDRVTVDPTAIPWLLLSAASTSGTEGNRLTDTTFIQRIATTGGLVPPAAGCNAATAGTESSVPYTADYYFWKRTGA
jgi:hypothetical protein